MLYLFWVWNRTWYVFWLLFRIVLCSAISFKSSRRGLSFDVAEHTSIMKNKKDMRIFVILQDRSMFSHIIRKVSARAFYWCGWTYAEKYYQNTYFPRFSFVPATGLAFPITGLLPVYRFSAIVLERPLGCKLCQYPRIGVEPWCLVRLGGEGCLVARQRITSRAQAGAALRGRPASNQFDVNLGGGRRAAIQQPRPNNRAQPEHYSP